MKMLCKLLTGCWYWFFGHIYALFLYDKKYLSGRWFDGKINGLCASGWKWVVHDARARIIMGTNKEAKFPVAPGCCVVHPQNLSFHPDDLNNFQTFGVYYQANGRITIGKGCYIAPNVGLITANHDYYNLDSHSAAKPIVLGDRCWIGMNSIVLSGIILGDNTIVGAGSVVTKSFPEGHCIIAGNPAKKIREL